MKSRIGCFCILNTMALALHGVCMEQARGNDSRPNIVLIMCDDMGYEGVSVYGSKTYSTPHLNQLAKSGMYFKHCYSTPICTPSRVQIMTGLYNFRNYIKFGQLPITEKTFANHLRDAGYRTGICGKWQLSGDAHTVQQFGFDTHCLWHLDGRDSRYWNPRISRNGQLLSGLEDAFGPDIMTDFACDFISAKSREPFLLYFPMTLPHWPFVPTPDSKPGGSRTPDGKYDGRAGGEEYFPDMVSYLDTLVGRIVTALRDSSQLDNTLLIFTCDNGCAINITSEMKGRQIKGGKASLPDNGTHVAMVAHWPAQFQQRGTQSQLVDFTDLLPTLCDVAGLSLNNLETDGHSLRPVFTGKGDSGRQWVYCHYIRNGFPKKPGDQTKESAAIKKQNSMIQAKTAGTFVRNQRYKLYGDGRFYDINNDVNEKHPLSQFTRKTTAVMTELQAVHDKMPKWAYFREN
ncbi:MAG: sulfatase-like hydrolase/transferase [Planctomycetota bacterium]|nr:sulfatase-like hydrolase/transferase [Planctomycetota bacterium]